MRDCEKQGLSEWATATRCGHQQTGFIFLFYSILIFFVALVFDGWYRWYIWISSRGGRRRDEVLYNTELCVFFRTVFEMEWQ